jgi:hypothetical protein
MLFLVETSFGVLTMNALAAIEIATKHVAAMNGGMISSAELCLADAIRLAADGKEQYAKDRAAKAVAYASGIFHPDYTAICRA